MAGKLEKHTNGSERFKRVANAAIDKIDDHETRIEKLEKASSGEIETLGIKDGKVVSYIVQGHLKATSA